MNSYSLNYRRFFILFSERIMDCKNANSQSASNDVEELPNY